MVWHARAPVSVVLSLAEDTAVALAEGKVLAATSRGAVVAVAGGSLAVDRELQESRDG